MMGRSIGVTRSRRTRGALWMLAALPMLVGPVVFDGDGSTIAVGLLFLILGVTAFRTQEPSATRTPDSDGFSTEI